MTRDEKTFMEAVERNKVETERRKEEFERCKIDPVYFYNTYVKPKGFPDLTPEQYDWHVAAAQLATARRFRRRRYIDNYPLPPKEMMP